MVCSVTCTWTQTATGYTDLKSYGVLSGSGNNGKLEACKEKCKYDSQCNGVTIKNSDYSCWTETFTVNSGDAPGNTHTTYLKSNCQGAYPRVLFRQNKTYPYHKPIFYQLTKLFIYYQLTIFQRAGIMWLPQINQD